MDAFVLRNTMKRQTATLLAHIDAIDRQDQEMASILDIEVAPIPTFASGNIFYHSSFSLGRLAGHIGASFLSVFVVIALLVTATAMGWSTTAQLLCNTPTMIVEGAMMLVLMMAHMAGHSYIRARLQAVLQRRLDLAAAVCRISGSV